MIQFQKVEKIFGTKKVLNNINLTIPEGVIYGIIGESGAGKSTLLRMINGLETIEKGSLHIEQVDIANQTVKEKQKSIQKTATVFQHFNLLKNKTVYQNVLEPLLMYRDISKEEKKARVDEALAFVGLSEYGKQYPAKLSGGQKQRVGIARALALRPKILLCDEATSALDPITARSISSLLKQINETYKTTIVFVTHQLEIARELCQYISVMEQGEVIESGDVFQIFTKPKHNITKGLIEHMLPQEYFDFADYPANRICKLQFEGDSASKSILFEVALRYDVKVNIIGGQIQHIQKRNFGLLIVGFEADEETFNQVKEALRVACVDVTELVKKGGTDNE